MRSPANTSQASSAVSRKPNRPLLIFGGCWLLLALLGWVDYITGYELGFFVFYSAPVGLAAWYLGRWPGIAVALGATITWWLADAFAGAKYASSFSFWWNSAIHFAAFLINAITISKIRLDLKQRDELANQLEATRETLRAMAETFPACPVCGAPHPGVDGAASAKMRDLVQANKDLSGALCVNCAPAGVRSRSANFSSQQNPNSPPA